jgi:hypothetical protein
MDQHVISEWLLKAFSAEAPRGRVLATYNKATGEYGQAIPSKFMVEVDAHPTDVEAGFGKIESAAALASTRLVRRVEALPPGLYSVTEEDNLTAAEVLQEVGQHGQMRLLLADRQVSSPPQVDREALGRFAALMYQRSPAIEAARAEVGEHYGRGVRAVAQTLPSPMRSDLNWLADEARARILDSALSLGPGLGSATWFVVRACEEESFVLGDCPIAATVSLGHDDVWRPILSSSSFALAMPLSPRVALLMAPQRLLPLSGVQQVSDFVPSINRLLWRWAGQYVLAPRQADLEGALGDADEATRRAAVTVETDPSGAYRSGIHDMTRIFAEVIWWHRWDGCRRVLGLPIAREDRDLVLGPPHQ